MEDKLKLSGGEFADKPRHGLRKSGLMGEIGDALLQRYEALERQHQREVEKFERQVSARVSSRPKMNDRNGQGRRY